MKRVYRAKYINTKYNTRRLEGMTRVNKQPTIDMTADVVRHGSRETTSKSQHAEPTSQDRTTNAHIPAPALMMKTSTVRAN